MPIPSFAELGVSPVVCDTLSRRGFAEPFTIQSLVIADVLAGRDVLAQSPTGSGKTLAFGVPMVDLLDPDGRAPGRAGARPDPRARLPDRRRDARGSPGPAGSGSRRLRRRRPAEAVARRRAGPHPRRHAGPARGPARAARVHAGARPDARPRRGRPDARHGLPARRSTASSRSARRPPDAVLLGHARRRGRPRRPRLHAPTPVPHEHRPTPSARAAIEHRFRAVGRDRRVERARRGAARRARPRPRLRAHQARRRPAGRGASARRASAPSPCTATSPRASASARWRASARAASTRSSPPTSPPAASTSTGISHVINFDPPEDARGLRPPHRPHRPRRADRHRHHVRRRPSRPATSAGSPPTCACSASSRTRAWPFTAGAAAGRTASRRARRPADGDARAPALADSPAAGQPALVTRRHLMVSWSDIRRPLRFAKRKVHRRPAGVAGVVMPVQMSEPAAP